MSKTNKAKQLDTKYGTINTATGFDDYGQRITDIEGYIKKLSEVLTIVTDAYNSEVKKWDTYFKANDTYGVEITITAQGGLMNYKERIDNFINTIDFIQDYENPNYKSELLPRYIADALYDATSLLIHVVKLAEQDKQSILTRSANSAQMLKGKTQKADARKAAFLSWYETKRSQFGWVDSEAGKVAIKESCKKEWCKKEFNRFKEYHKKLLAGDINKEKFNSLVDIHFRDKLHLTFSEYWKKYGTQENNRYLRRINNYLQDK